MPRIEIALRSRSDETDRICIIEALDLPTALTIADINTPAGSADILQDGKCLARLTKHGREQATFWEVGPA